MSCTSKAFSALFENDYFGLANIIFHCNESMTEVVASL